MRNRKQRRNIYHGQNLDSFLDILTNTVGVLMFVGLFVTLLAVEAGTIVRTPLVSKTKKYPHYFEIRNNQLIYIDEQKINQQLGYFYTTLFDCDRPSEALSTEDYFYDYYQEKLKDYQQCVSKRKEKIDKFRVDTNYYTVRFIDSNSLIYEPKESTKGEAIAELNKNNSEFNQIIDKLDPNINYLAFIVRPDSFKTFRAARKNAWEKGFDVGWEPYQQETPIIFGSGGRSIGVQ